MDSAKPASFKRNADTPGAHYDGRGVSFALFSANAAKVELCLFDDTGTTETARIPLPRAGDLWHGYVEGVKPGQVYGYRVYGPHDPQNGHLFTPDKVMLDPYARDIIPGKNLGRVLAPAAPPQKQKPDTPWQDTIIYEAHVKGLTQEFPGLAADKRGTFAGLADDKVIAYLKALGITAIELLPVQAHGDEAHLKAKGLRNYWGYNTLGFFAPDPRFGGPADFRAMVEKLHNAGIEVILDVVYNHTCEGKAGAPAQFLRGIDNASYYRLDPNDKSRYIDDTGCGNTLNMDHPQARRMVLDSLRYWAQEMGVDGFRFDLAVTLGRAGRDFSADSPLMKDIAADPVLSKCKLIAEPWDLGPGGYRLGGFPKAWREWNDRFRDTVRAFWRGDDGMTPRLADRVAGSSPEFRSKGASSASINYITAHDGFTLQDVVSYDRKHNEANGENNRDGHDPNYSHNYGVEGPTNDPAVTELRNRQKRNMLATLLLSQGIPMMLAGDEFGNSQNGNNNAYCQDNPTGWLDWAGQDKELAAFVQTLIRLRQEYPILRHPAFLDGQKHCRHNIKDIEWFAPDGAPMTVRDWHNPKLKTLGVLFNSAAAGISGDERLFVVFNADAADMTIRLPSLTGGNGWQRILDTAAPGGSAQAPENGAYSSQSRSLQVFVQKPRP